MKQIVRFTLALPCFFAALWLPFYIGGVFLPEGWLTSVGPVYWWSIPMIASLIALAVGLALLGVILLDYFKP